MSPFIRRYAKYLSEKSGAYRGTAMDFCKVKRGSVVTDLVTFESNSDNVNTGKTGEHSGPWAETSYLKLCPSSRIRWTPCSSLIAQQQ